MPNDDTASGSSPEEEEAESELSQTDSSTDKEDGESSDQDEEPKVPYSRFKQVNDTAKYWQRVAAAEQAKAQAAQQAAAQKPESAVEYTPEQLEQVKRVMRLSDAQYREMMEERERQKQEAAQAHEQMLDDTHDEIMKLAKANGLPLKDDEVMKAVGQSVMLTIKNDHKLLRRWQNGDLGTVGDAFQKIHGAFGGRKNGASQANVARVKRQVVGLPTAPSGGAGTVTAAPPKGKEEKGITKQTHDRAWALLQQTSE